MGHPIIWQTIQGDQTEFEFEWITKDLLAHVQPQEWHFDCGTYTTIRDNALIIYSSNARTASAEFLSYLDKYTSKGYTFFLLHLSDENLSHDCSYYHLAKHVFRNYWNAHMAYPSNVTVIPLGYKSGFRNPNRILFGDRSIPTCFIGQVKRGREELVKALYKIPNAFIHTTTRWNCSTALSPSEVARIYLITKFVPCPRGWIHADSFRICEALEWGAVPVLKEGDCIGWEHCPFPVVKEWDELIDLSYQLDFAAVQSTCYQWYVQYKQKLASTFANTLGYKKE